MKNFGPVPNKDWEFLFLYDKIHPKYRILFFVFRYIYGYKENREKGFFTIRRLQDLADFLKMHRKMLWKYLKQLEEEGLIWRKGKRIGIGKWSEFYRFVPEKVTREVMIGPVVMSEPVAEFPRYSREIVPEMAANSGNVPNMVTNMPQKDEFVPITQTNSDARPQNIPSITSKEPITVIPQDLFGHRKNMQTIPSDLNNNTDMEEDEEDYSTWTEKEIFGKFYPYRRFFPPVIDHPEQVDEYFINVILPAVTKHFPGYTFNPANPNLKAFFREYERILKPNIIANQQTKITG
ncbi:replication protein [bacterium]|nr:replication protein [bacterium]